MSEYKPLTCLPVLPLRGLVVFPGVVTHFDVGRLKSAKSVEEAMRADQRIFLTAQKDLSVDDPKKNDLYAVGTVAHRQADSAHAGRQYAYSGRRQIPRRAGRLHPVRAVFVRACRGNRGAGI